ncbi:MAG: energy-coupling factor transporter ATPase [Anaerolineaceae bacterium]|jgi:energy-coupling factor transport system ATP-binding protein|nr:energy-coupling factor transporter ATPase [Anaerolineaceae bacterium]
MESGWGAMNHLIEVNQITYTHDRQNGETPPALCGVSLQIAAGEMIAMIGSNGSGKTTLARHLNGLLLPTTGTVRVAGLDTSLPDNRQTILSTVGMVFQFPEDQMVATVVENDVAFGVENLGLRPAEVRQRVETALREVEMWAWRSRPPHLLSAGQMQRVALAGILAMKPRCIVFDEATAMLDPAGRRTVMEIMHRLHQEGLTIIYITHYMEEAAQAGRVIVLDRGQVALDGSPREVFSDAERLVKLGLDLPPAVKAAAVLHEVFPALPQDLLTLDDLLAALPHAPAGVVPPVAVSQTRPVEEFEAWIEVSGLSHTYLLDTPFAYQALQEVDMRVAKGGSQGLIGGTGSGKSTLMQHLNCLFKPFTGRVRVGQFDFNAPEVTVYQVCQMAGLVFQNPEAQFFEQYAGDEIAYGPRLQGLDKPVLRQRVQWAMEMVGLDFETFKDRLTFTLSGGEKRKVALASILALQPEVLLLDEPTAGLDPHSRKELIAHLQALRAQGMTFVVSSHHMDDLAVLTERLLVLHHGRVEMEGSLGEVFSDAEALQALGLAPPPAARIAEKLRQNGWPIPAGVVDLQELKNALVDMPGGMK